MELIKPGKVTDFTLSGARAKVYTAIDWAKAFGNRDLIFRLERTLDTVWD